MPYIELTYLEENQSHTKTLNGNDQNLILKYENKKIIKLIINDCNINDNDLKMVLRKSGSTLTHLEIENCPITDISIPSIAVNFRKLTHLSLKKVDKVRNIDAPKTTAFFNSKLLLFPNLTTLMIKDCANLSRINILAPLIEFNITKCSQIPPEKIFIKNFGVFYLGLLTTKPEQILKNLIKTNNNENKKTPSALPQDRVLNIAMLQNTNNKKQLYYLTNKSLMVFPSKTNPPFISDNNTFADMDNFVTNSHPALAKIKKPGTETQPENKTKENSKTSEDKIEENSDIAEFGGVINVNHKHVNYQLRLWIIGTTEKFKSLTQSYIRDAAVVVWQLSPEDLNDDKAITSWLTHMQEKNKEIPVLILDPTPKLNITEQEKIILSLKEQAKKQEKKLKKNNSQEQAEELKNINLKIEQKTQALEAYKTQQEKLQKISNLFRNVKHSNYSPDNITSIQELAIDMVKLGRKTTNVFVETPTGSCRYQATAEYSYHQGMKNFRDKNYFAAYQDFMQAMERDPSYSQNIDLFLSDPLGENKEAINTLNN